MAGNRKLGEFLRSRRLRLPPAEAGIAVDRPRRTPGLLREEVARLAGISTEWYVRLEQGRAVAPPSGTIEALADALRFDRTERRHLHALARCGARAVFARESVPDLLRGVVEGLSEPAYLTGQRFDVLAWNDAAAALLVDFGALPVEDRNILLFMLGDPAARHLFGATWAGEARRMVSLFRATFDLWPGDPAFARLVARLEACTDFAAWWAEHEVASPGSGRKILIRPDGVAVAYDYATFQANDDPALKLAIYARR